MRSLKQLPHLPRLLSHTSDVRRASTLSFPFHASVIAQRRFVRRAQSSLPSHRLDTSHCATTASATNNNPKKQQSTKFSQTTTRNKTAYSRTQDVSSKPPTASSTMSNDEGATPRELLIESARRNNTSLLTTLFSPTSPTTTATFLNTTTDALGASALHIAAQYGAYDVLDTLLDQEGVEIDNPDRREGDTALHKAVRFVSEARGRGDREEEARGRGCVEILVDAGCDPRIRNKAKLRPVDLADPRDAEVRLVLQRAEMAMQLGGDVVDEDEDEGREGPGSESD